MHANRISPFLHGAGAKPADDDNTGFIANPFGSATPDWQIQMYQAAYLKAQKDLQADSDAWPIAEFWD